MEQLGHIISGGLHILAAVTWIGSMIYSSAAVTPALKPMGMTKAEATNMMIMKKFSWLTWTSLILLVITGIFAVSGAKDKLAPSEPAGTVLILKLILVAVLIGILLAQIYVYGPKMKRLLDPVTPKNQESNLAMNKTVRISSTLSSVHLWTGIAIIILAVILSQLLK